MQNFNTDMNGKGGGFMVFNNISVILWQSVLLVEYKEATTDLSQVTNKLYHIMLFNSPPLMRFELTNLLVIGTDYTGNDIFLVLSI